MDLKGFFFPLEKEKKQLESFWKYDGADHGFYTFIFTVCLQPFLFSYFKLVPLLIALIFFAYLEHQQETRMCKIHPDRVYHWGKNRRQDAFIFPIIGFIIASAYLYVYRVQVIF